MLALQLQVQVIVIGKQFETTFDFYFRLYSLIYIKCSVFKLTTMPY